MRIVKLQPTPHGVHPHTGLFAMSDPILSLDPSLLTRVGDVVGFDYTDRFGHEAEGFVVRTPEGVRAWRNACPHWDIPMDPDDLWDEDTQQIVCPFHGACFEPDEGLCTSGPPEGARLDPLGLKVDPQTGRIEVFLQVGLSFGF